MLKVTTLASNHNWTVVVKNGCDLLLSSHHSNFLINYANNAYCKGLLRLVQCSVTILDTFNEQTETL